MKKCISLCLALILCLALAVTASAAEADGPTASFSTGGAAVMVNGETVDFDGAKPEISGGRTMVPMRGVLEALGAEVDYDHPSKTVTATLDGTSLTHVIGTDKIDVSGGQTLTMDAASYVKNGGTMVPLRFFSQALGYEVYWDKGQRTAVVLDKQGIIDEIDASFSILNDLQAKQSAELTGNLAMEMDFNGTVKLLDSISGDQELPFSMEMTGLYGPSAINAQGSMDLSLLSTLMEAMDEEVPQELADLLENLDFQMIYSESGMWMQMPAMAELLRASGADGLPEGEIWFGMTPEDLGELGDIYQMSFAANSGSATIGGVLYAMVEMMDAEVPVNIYEDVAEAASVMAALVGDGTFTGDGDDYTWEMDQAMMDQLAEVLGASSVAFPGSMKMTLGADGSCEFTMDLAVEEDPLALTMTISGTSTATDSSVEGSIQVKNVCDVTFQGSATVQPTDEAPVSAPPADAAVVDLYGAEPLAAAA